MQRTKIEWLKDTEGNLGYTWNPIAMRCTPVSAGCRNCWSLRMVKRCAQNPLLKSKWSAYRGGTPMLDNKELSAPLRLRKPARIGVQFMGDLFHERVPDEFIARVWSTMGAAQQHTFIVLTKRPERMAAWLNSVKMAAYEPLTNVILMTSVEDQESADLRIPYLLRCKGHTLGVSYEPALGPVDFRHYGHIGYWRNSCRCGAEIIGHIYEPEIIMCQHCGNHISTVFEKRLDWIILGGETGPGARPMHPGWARSVRDQCKAAGTAFYFKQWGEWAEFVTNGPLPEETKFACVHRAGGFRDWTDDCEDGDECMGRVGHARAGRLLDGVEHSEVPKP